MACPLRPTSTRPSPADNAQALVGLGDGVAALPVELDDEERAAGAGLDLLDGEIGEGAVLRHDHHLDGETEIAQRALQLAHLSGFEDEACGLRKQDHLGDALGADMGRQHHLVGAGMDELALGGDGVAAGDDLDRQD